LNITKIFKDQNEIFLFDYLIAKLEAGSNTKNALILFNTQLKEGKLKTRINNVINDLEKGTKHFEETFYENKFINFFEYGVLVNSSNNIVNGLKLIKKMDNESSNLFKHMLKPILLPLSIIFIVFLGLYFYLGILDNEIKYFTKHSPDMLQYLDIPKYFNYTFTYIGLSISIIAIFFVLFGYIYYYNKKPYVIYKYIKTQAFGDSRFLFRILYELLNIGIPLHKATELLSENYYKVGMRIFFKELSIAIKKKEKLYKVFEKYNFPIIITSDIKLSELSNTQYSVITKNIYTTCDNIFENNLTSLKLQLGTVFWLVATLVSTIICTDIINLVISNFTFKVMY